MKRMVLLFVGLMFGFLSLLFAEAHVVYNSKAPNPGRFAACMEASGWDGSGECNGHTDDCGNCYTCCGDGYLCNGSGSDLARAEWQTCITYCGLDHTDCGAEPDNPPDGGQSSGGGGSSS